MDNRPVQVNPPRGTENLSGEQSNGGGQKDDHSAMPKKQNPDIEGVPAAGTMNQGAV